VITDKDLARSLARLAKLCSFDLDADILELYDAALAPVGYAQVCRAIDEMATNMEPGKRQWPSVNSIKRACGIDVPAPLPTAERAEDDAARTTAALIVAAVAKFGSVLPGAASTPDKLEKIRAYVGEAAWSLILLRNGWNSVCDSLSGESPVAVVEAQLRELAKAIVNRRRMGLGDTPPGLPPRPDRSGDLRPISANDAASVIPAGLRRPEGQ
jgi:hypothetical protein